MSKAAPEGCFWIGPACHLSWPGSIPGASTRYNKAMGLTIVKASGEDIGLIQDILTQAVKYKVDHGDMAWGTKAYSEAEAKRLVDSGNAYVAMLGDEVVGTFLLQWEDDIIWDDHGSNAGYIHQLAIKNGFHGKGLGKQVINWAGQEAIKNGKEFLRLDCNDNNTGLCAYYEGQGFRQVGLKSIPAYNNYTAALYERQL